MTHVEICPICHGKGVLEPDGRYCNGCGGRGWIEVNDYYPYSYIYTNVPHYVIVKG